MCAASRQRNHQYGSCSLVLEALKLLCARENTCRCCAACCEGSMIRLQEEVRGSTAELLPMLQGCWGTR